MKNAVRAVGQQVVVEWPLEDGTSEQLDATITAVCTRHKRKYQVRFADGDMRWSRLKRVPLPEPPADGSSGRPYYIGTTDPGVAREWVARQLSLWAAAGSASRKIGTYYMCVGGLSGFDGLLALCTHGATVDRLVLYDRGANPAFAWQPTDLAVRQTLRRSSSRS